MHCQPRRGGHHKKKLDKNGNLLLFDYRKSAIKNKAFNYKF